MPGSLDGVREWVAEVGLGGVGAVREVEDPDIEPVVGLVLDDPVDRGDDLGDVRPSVGNTDLEAHDARIGRDAEEVGRVGRVGPWLGVAAASGDDPGHERAVTVGVEVGQVWRLGLERKVRTVDDLVGGAQALHRRNAGIDQGDIYSLARVAGVPPRRGTGIRGRVVHGIHVADGVVAGRPDTGRSDC